MIYNQINDEVSSLNSDEDIQPNTIGIELFKTCEQVFLSSFVKNSVFIFLLTNKINTYLKIEKYFHKKQTNIINFFIEIKHCKI
jgi:hypothetical protein